MSSIFSTHRNLVKTLKEATKRFKMDIEIPDNLNLNDIDLSDADKLISIRRAICHGFFLNILVANGPSKAGYLVPNCQHSAFLHPGTVFYQNNMNPKFAVYRTLKKTSKFFLIDITEVDPDWILEDHPEYASSINLTELKEHTLVPIPYSLSRTSQNAIIGRSRIKANRLEKMYGILIESLDDGRLNVWSKPDQIRQTEVVIGQEVEKVIQRLRTQREFVSLGGGIQGVFSAGGELDRILFPGEFMRVSWRNLPSDFVWTKANVVDELKSMEESYVMDVQMINRDEKRSNGVLTFYDPKKAKEMQEVYESHSMKSRECTMKPYMSGEVREYSQEKSKMTFEYYLGESQNRGFVKFNTMEEANGAQMSASRLPCHERRVHAKVMAPRAQGRGIMMMVHNISSAVDERRLYETFPRATFAKVYRKKPEVKLSEESARILRTFRKYADEDGIMVYSQEDRSGKFGVRVYGYINFREKDKAVRADEDFNPPKAGLLGAGKLYLMKHIGSTITLHRAVIKTLKPEITKLVGTLENIYPRLRINVNERKLAIFINGDDEKSIQEAKTQIEALIGAEVYKCENSSDLKTLKYDRGKIFKQIIKDTACELHWDWRRNEIRMFGSQTVRDKASEQLTAAIKRLVEFKFIQEKIRLPPRGAHKITQAGGIEELTKTGASVSWSGAKYLNVRGTAEQVTEVREKLTKFGVLDGSGTGESSCHICFCEIESQESVVQLQSCSHLFHKECMDLQINNILSKDQGGRPVTCTECQEKLSIQDIRGMLNSHQAEEFWALCFGDFVSKNLSTYGYCLTADCDQVHQKTDNLTSWSCPRCSQEYCLRCSERCSNSMGPHAGISCEENAQTELTVGGLFEKLIAEGNECKQCPKCSAITFKNGGCNHMTCRSCQNHYCWVCRFSADNGSAVYTHMRAAHGGISG